MKLIDKDALVAEIEKLKGQLLRGACSSQISMQTRCKEESYDEVLALLDTIQEEPVSEDLGEYINELSKQFPEVSFAKLSRIAVRVAKWMMKDAVEETVDIDSNGLACVNVNDDDIMIGDTVKVLIKKGGKQ